MSENWERALKYAKGEYVAIFSEKFMLRPDALEILSDIVSVRQPDIITWQFDYFEIANPDEMIGNYNPVFMPAPAQEYSPDDELKRRLSFVDPLFSRHKQELNGRGKIYSGCVKKSLVLKLKDDFGRIFFKYSPDFTSMILFLRYSKSCIDVGQSLMLLVVGKGISNGSDTRQSVKSILKFLRENNENFKQYCHDSIIPGFGIGHSVSIASDFKKILSLSGYYFSGYEINIPAVLGWSFLEIEYVIDWDVYSKDYFTSVLESFRSKLKSDEIFSFESVFISNEMNKKPSPREIFFSGLKISDSIFDSIMPEALAELNWISRLVIPKSQIKFNVFTISQAVDYLYLYNKKSCEIFRLQNSGFF